MRDDAFLFEIAKLHFERGLSQAHVAELKGLSRVKVNRLLQAARDRGIVRVLVVPRFEHAYLRAVEDELKAAYHLEDVLLVPGREEILTGTLDANTQEAIVESLAYLAADYLDRHLSDDDVLCINWGRVMRSIADHLRPTKTLPALTVLPLLGSLSAQPEPYEANVLAQEIASAYGADFNWLIAPAIVRDQQQKTVAMELPLVKDTLAQIRQATMAITTLAPADPVDATVVRRGWLEAREVEALIERGAIGEICSWWFDARGREVRDDRIYPIGLGLDGLKSMVREGKKVVAVVGADRARLAPTHAALIGKIVNILITDHMTAQYLIKFRDQEALGEPNL
jgi:deoxyribonucleoside regulator